MPVPHDRLWSRFLAITYPFLRAPGRAATFALLGLVLALILALGGLNVVGSYMNRDFMTAVADRDSRHAFLYGGLWVGVFLALTVTAVFKAFAEDRLRLRWRRWLTRRFVDQYLTRRAYYFIKDRADVDNPDQRITEDVRTFTDSALALLLILFNATIALVSFSGILWSITPWLFLAAVGWAACGSLAILLFGRRLVVLNGLQFRKEADFRYQLMQVRTNADTVALVSGETDERGRLYRGLDALVANMRAIIALSRNIGFFTTGYDYLNILLPLLIVAPLYVAGRVEFGTVTQAQMAFLHVMGAFSVIVKEFPRISAFGAVVERLGTFQEALHDAEKPRPSAIEIEDDPRRLAFEDLTLTTPQDHKVLIRDLTVEVPRGRRLLILGPKGSGRTVLLRAAAGLWASGQGRIIRPPLGDIHFLPHQPYLRSGTLRDQLVYATGHPQASRERLREVIGAVGFQPVVNRVGGLQAECDWPTTLSLGEQQQVGFIRLLLARPPFAFLDESGAALSEDRLDRAYEALHASPITYVSADSDPRLRRFHDLVIEIGLNGRWTLTPALPTSPQVFS